MKPGKLHTMILLGDGRPVIDQHSDAGMHEIDGGRSLVAVAMRL